jgi:outer membrane biosynthesis protein TonB
MPIPSLETPPNSAPPTQPVKVRTGRYGELEEHELIHLLDSLDDERSKARFRESIYISIIIYMGIVWFLFYGPRVLFHQPKLISPVDVLREREKQQLTFLDTPKDLSSLSPKPKAVPQKAPTQQLDQKTLRQLQAMRKAELPARTPAPPPAQPAPQQAAPTPPAPQPPPPAPPPTQQALVEAPRPAPPTRPNFGNPNQSAGDAIRKAAQEAARDRGAGDYTPNSPGGSRQGMGTGVEVLSDTQGVDFGPYIRRILGDIKRNWIPLIPEEARPPLNKQGETLIRFTILSDGRIAAMNLDGSSQDTAIDRACWGGITGVGQFPPLPANFKGPSLELRVDFLTNKPLP